VADQYGVFIRVLLRNVFYDIAAQANILPILSITGTILSFTAGVLRNIAGVLLNTAAFYE
jgi:hypothetical protein